MVLASLGSDLVDGGGMAVVVGMAILLLHRATRTRAEDREEE